MLVEKINILDFTISNENVSNEEYLYETLDIVRLRDNNQKLISLYGHDFVEDLNRLKEIKLMLEEHIKYKNEDIHIVNDDNNPLLMETLDIFRKYIKDLTFYQYIKLINNSPFIRLLFIIKEIETKEGYIQAILGSNISQEYLDDEGNTKMLYVNKYDSETRNFLSPNESPIIKEIIEDYTRFDLVFPGEIFNEYRYTLEYEQPIFNMVIGRENFIKNSLYVKALNQYKESTNVPEEFNDDFYSDFTKIVLKNIIDSTLPDTYISENYIDNIIKTQDWDDIFKYNESISLMNYIRLLKGLNHISEEYPNLFETYKKLIEDPDIDYYKGNSWSTRTEFFASVSDYINRSGDLGKVKLNEDTIEILVKLIEDLYRKFNIGVINDMVELLGPNRELLTLNLKKEIQSKLLKYIILAKEM